MTSVEGRSVDAELEAEHRSIWEMGDYPAVAAEVIPELGSTLVEACGVRAGATVLDVACGAGNAAIPAALRGARVTGCDLSPALLEVGGREARPKGAEISWRQGNAEALPFADGEFDVVMSCVGVMFAPHHRAAADELVRVCRPGGTIGLANWTPEGFVGQMFSVMKPYVAPPPAGVRPPPSWGDEDYVRALLGDRVVDLEAARRTVRVDGFSDPEDFRDYFKSKYGPTVAAYRALAGHADRVAALDRDLAELARRGAGTRPDGRLAPMDWEYLLLTGRRAS